MAISINDVSLNSSLNILQSSTVPGATESFGVDQASAAGELVLVDGEYAKVANNGVDLVAISAIGIDAESTQIDGVETLSTQPDTSEDVFGYIDSLSAGTMNAIAANMEEQGMEAMLLQSAYTDLIQLRQMSGSTVNETVLSMLASQL